MYLNWREKNNNKNTQSVIIQYNLKLKKKEKKKLLLWLRICKWQQNNTFQCEAMINTHTKNFNCIKIIK